MGLANIINHLYINHVTYTTFSRLFHEMIKYAMAKKGLQYRVESIGCDFETAIQAAIEEAFPGVEIRGSRFLYAQSLWRKAEREYNKTLKTSKMFSELVRSCLARPFIMTDELQVVVDNLKEKPMENENVEKVRNEYMQYIQSTWIDGVYSPYMWSCFGRKNDHTNNAQEAYNSVLNR